MNSPFHTIINEIREKYGYKKVTMLDVYDIEKAYMLTSIVNIRNDNCAFLRMTCFGQDEVLFEDIVTNVDSLKKYITIDELDFEIKRLLYLQAYGVNLENHTTRLLSPEMHHPSFNFSSDKEDIKQLKKRCEELEKSISILSGDQYQTSMFED